MINDRRPYATLIPYTWMRDSHQTPGILFRHGTRPLLHVTADEARTLADNLHDMADRIEAEPDYAAAADLSPAIHAGAPQRTRPLYARHSTQLTAADGTPEPQLPTTPTESE